MKNKLNHCKARGRKCAKDRKMIQVIAKQAVESV